MLSEQIVIVVLFSQYFFNCYLCSCDFRNVAKHKQRIAGKSLPFEKFACSRVDKFKATGTLILPALVSLYFLFFSVYICVFKYLML